MTERLTLADHAAAAVPLLSRPENHELLERLIDDLAAIIRDSVPGGAPERRSVSPGAGRW